MKMENLLKQKERLILKPKSIEFDKEAMKFHGVTMKKQIKKD